MTDLSIRLPEQSQLLPASTTASTGPNDSMEAKCDPACLFHTEQGCFSHRLCTTLPDVDCVSTTHSFCNASHLYRGCLTRACDVPPQDTVRGSAVTTIERRKRQVCLVCMQQPCRQCLHRCWRGHGCGRIVPSCLLSSMLALPPPLFSATILPQCRLSYFPLSTYHHHLSICHATVFLLAAARLSPHFSNLSYPTTTSESPLLVLVQQPSLCTSPLEAFYNK